MPRRIRIQVDTSPLDTGPLGIGVLLHDATEAEDTSGRQFLFELLEGAVRKVCGHNVDSEYDRGRAMFGIWNTQFLIPTESHTEENRRALQTELGRIYHAHKDIVRGF